jgi:ubiquinone/menaquinone biosynthesis C-methylase UbiE
VHDRDVDQFNRRAASYERGRLQEHFFVPIQRRTLEVAAALSPTPASVLDVGCGTGSLLCLAGRRFPDARLAGVDAAAEMIKQAHADGAEFRHAPAERLPFADAGFDLVTSTMSFHHWKDQRQGIAEIARVLAPGGVLVIADYFATAWLRPLLALLRRRDRVHTRAEVDGMLAAAGLAVAGWRRIFELDPLMLVRDRQGRSAIGTLGFVFAVCARKPGN